VSEDLFRPQLGEPHHYAYVVEDIEATVNRLVGQLGAVPFFLVENVPLENLLSRGEPAEFVHNSAFGYRGGSLEQRGLPRYLSAQLGETDNTFHYASASLGHDIEIHVDCKGLRLRDGERRRGLGRLGTAAPSRELIAGSGTGRTAPPPMRTSIPG
jgi:hypothetical protein